MWTGDTVSHGGRQHLEEEAAGRKVGEGGLGRDGGVMDGGGMTKYLGDRLRMDFDLISNE